MQLGTLRPRDYALLVRQKAEDYEIDLAPAFTSCGLRLRNELRKVGDVQTQDILAEELTEWKSLADIVVIPSSRIEALRSNFKR